MRPKGSFKNLEERFSKKYIIDEKTDCWIWQNAKNNIGYGMIRVFDKMRTAHRVSYELYKGKIPDDKLVCHTCDNPACVNPDHLWIGTNQDNSDDMKNKGRHKQNHYFFGDRPIVDCQNCGRQIKHNAIKNHLKACLKNNTK